MPCSMPGYIKDLKLSSLSIEAIKNSGCKILFSALPSDLAAKLEPELRKEGFYIFSNAGAMRREENVPILIPETNAESLQSIENQGFPGKGFVVTNANCSTTGLALALAPLRSFGIEEITVSTYQSISGAGYPGMSAMDIQGNLIPHISGEEEKMVYETCKILGIDPVILVSCVRVPVKFGHLETVWLKFTDTPSLADVKEAWKNFKADFVSHSTPKKPVIYIEDETQPQPAISFEGNPGGMTVYTGRLRKENGKIGFVLLVNNIIRGAAGGSVQNAELFIEKYGGSL